MIARAAFIVGSSSSRWLWVRPDATADTLVAQLCERLADKLSNANATVAGEGDYRLSRNGRIRSVM
jgi:hypothetical protein